MEDRVQLKDWFSPMYSRFLTAFIFRRFIRVFGCFPRIFWNFRATIHCYLSGLLVFYSLLLIYGFYTPSL